MAIEKNGAGSLLARPRAQRTQRQLRQVWARKHLYPQGSIQPPALALHLGAEDKFNRWKYSMGWWGKRVAELLGRREYSIDGRSQWVVPLYSGCRYSSATTPSQRWNSRRFPFNHPLSPTGRLGGSGWFNRKISRNVEYISPIWNILLFFSFRKTAYKKIRKKKRERKGLMKKRKRRRDDSRGLFEKEESFTGKWPNK